MNGSLKVQSAKFKLTNCSRGIRNAWHFYYALNLVIKVVCGGFCIASLTP
ncbi:DUF3265 domain-containing protein [Vibrio parahaemolyticus]|nr:DUF3265 domain-containing protein [Vibrio parahaemolyticus]EJC7057017.1 DUF3265 domain-containing protein [Vibrio parahaemolyticus]EJC7100364.1 DUF3265 domain-containing protein [Vibrio parahaemolyticus]EJC7113961.1 DUF3265 domain-containing protein [Vibrio parahaemolyticus]EJC7133191.1 DUF3265 domain-containing protein [Vibrio parahaemolyticus]